MDGGLKVCVYTWPFPTDIIWDPVSGIIALPKITVLFVNISKDAGDNVIHVVASVEPYQSANNGTVSGHIIEILTAIIFCATANWNRMKYGALLVGE